MDVLEGIWQVVAKGMAFLSDLMTVVVGTITLYGIFWYRKEFRALVTLLAASHMHVRVKRIMETLAKLVSLNYEVKENRNEIYNLLGELSGQIGPLVSQIPCLDSVHKEMASLSKKETKLSEPIKRRIINEIHGALENEALAASISLLGNQK